ncbi:MAG: winged helix-turn-helix transcriptional regulator [Kineosporiaceae bacterium]|nr:winged helix-turn-helix transcriptional regulator [Kineosporiaceae bacterium]
MTGQYTLDQTEHAVAERLSGLPVDHTAMAAIGGLYRAAGAVRNHFERTVLAHYDLSWTGWVVLWVVWVWRDIETRHAASEAGITKSTLTGVVKTLEARDLVRRRIHPADGRRVILSLTPGAGTLMAELFPRLNAQEVAVLAGLDEQELSVLVRALRTIVLGLETTVESPALSPVL